MTEIRHGQYVRRPSVRVLNTTEDIPRKYEGKDFIGLLSRKERIGEILNNLMINVIR